MSDNRNSLRKRALQSRSGTQRRGVKRRLCNAAPGVRRRKQALHPLDGLLRTGRWLCVPLEFAPHSDFFERYRSLSDAIASVSKQPDPLLREFALLKLESLADEASTLARGTIVFTATETWRTVYRKLLESLNARSYYSVAWVRTGAYWNDPPGRRSMTLNYELAARGYRIERIHILSDAVWPIEASLPSPEIRPWLDEQRQRGIHVSLVRESDLVEEPDLLCDFAIYGDRATGVQELDERARTLRFTLHFDQASRRNALDRWERLSLYAESYGDLLDRYGATD